MRRLSGADVETGLMRVVAVGDELVPDLRGRLPGRGAHVHPDTGCLDLAERRRAFSRALHLPGPLEASAVRRAIESSTSQGSIRCRQRKQVE